MRYVKMNGCGNRFAIFDARQNPIVFKTSHLVAIAEDSQADQIIIMEPAKTAADNSCFMRIYNRDGSEVSACGNASRCVAAILMQESGRDIAHIITKAGTLIAHHAGDQQIRIDMGAPNFDWQAIPLAEAMDTRKVDIKIGPLDAPYLFFPAAASMGNPHLVFFVEDISAHDIEAVGALLEWHPLLPEGANIGIAQIIAPDHIRLRVFERGAGLTLACGTGACAALACAVRLGHSEPAARLELDGGDLHIFWDEADNHIHMRGPFAYDGVGQWQS